ncbi:MAG: translation initiation factor IF-3 [Candidatus Yanofskybacteria bacterium CG10_big_fil_rev_8_21_14_0_10_46_23]|uniref:Translation initiation factor IF-3 n=1 Tax=Candidatus Yanofskybacteria bacterium CG10_big_fil_rev_8_21_14_0_10_46_23 TaxID=1975098 RepID=A0A2H0R3G5_9BACT|nr:MAG: translation initiation factor IF-3 [Candidatus Yanofskybacteria bacterium CG10_big_fil_rev_8_21_14_0_10_46_23]
MKRRKYKQKLKREFIRVNESIRIPQVQVVDELGKKVGIMETAKALKLAREKGLDLVEIAPTNRPPIVKITDYGKYMYDKGQKEKGQKQSTPAQEMKTVRIGLRTGDHDLEVKAQQADRFLKKGHPVRLEIFLKGRERGMQDEARKRIEHFPNFISQSYVIDGKVKPSPRGFAFIIRPAK